MSKAALVEGIVLAMTLVLGCGGGGSDFSISPTALTITTSDQAKFTASSGNVGWTVQEQGGGYFGGADGIYTASYFPGTYHVLATNLSNTSQTARATVTVVSPGSAAITAPSTVNHDTVGITASVPVQPGCTYLWSGAGITFKGSTTGVSVTFDAPPPGSYTLACAVTNAAGKATQGQQSLYVASAPTIQSFTATPGSILGGGSAQLTATFTGGTGNIVGIGSVNTGVAVQVSPALTTTYALQVTNPAGEVVSQQLVLPVIPVIVTTDPTPVVATGGNYRPKAQALGAPDPTIVWTVTEGSGAGALSQDANGPLFTPATRGTCHLVARLASDPSTTLTVPLQVVAPFSAAGPYEVRGYDSLSMQPVHAPWSHQSRFIGPRDPNALKQIWTLRSKTYRDWYWEFPAFSDRSGAIYLTTDGGELIKVDRYGRFGWVDGQAPGLVNFQVAGVTGIDNQNRILVVLVPRTGQSAWSIGFVDPDTGALLSQFPINDPTTVLQSPIPRLMENGDVLVQQSGGGLARFSPAGVKQWEVDIPPAPGYLMSFRTPIPTSSGLIWTVVSGDGTSTLNALDGTGHILTSVPGVQGLSVADGQWALGPDGSVVVGTSAGVQQISPRGQINWTYANTASTIGVPLPSGGYALVQPNMNFSPLVFLAADGTLVASRDNPGNHWTLLNGFTVPLVDAEGYTYVMAPANSGSGASEVRLMVYNPDTTLAWTWTLPGALQGQNVPTLLLGPDRTFYFQYLGTLYAMGF